VRRVTESTGKSWKRLLVRSRFVFAHESLFLFDATALKYAGIAMMISARVGDLFIHNGKSATLTNFREPMYKNNLREAVYGMDEASSG